MSVPLRYLLVIGGVVASAAASLGQAPPVGPPADGGYLAHVASEANQLATEVRRFLEDITDRAAVRPDRQLYRQAEAALEKVRQFQDAVRRGVNRDRLYREFAEADRAVQDLVKAVQALGPQAEPFQRWIRRVSDADQQLHFALSQGDTSEGRGREVIQRQARALAAESRSLYGTTRYALPDNLPNRGEMESQFGRFAEAAEHFARSVEQGASRPDLHREFAGLNEAWKGLSNHLRSLPPRASRALVAKAERVDEILERLHQRLGIEGERNRFLAVDLQAAIAAGKPFMIVSRDSGKCLDLTGASRVNGGPVQQWDYTGGANQKWLIQPVDRGWFRIVNVNSGKCLEVQGASPANGARIDQSDFTGQPNQLWRPVPVGGGYYKIIDQQTGKCLDVAYASKDNGGYIHQWDYTGVPNQQWQIIPVE